MTHQVIWVPHAPDTKRPAYAIQAKPHVMIRLKRCIDRISKAQLGTVLLADTPQNARDLLWFVDRYPLAISPEAQARLNLAADAHRKSEERVAAILAGDASPTGPLTMALPAREYQQLAANLVAATGRLLLADDLGLGKTISAIATIATTGKLPALVVTLTHLPRQWMRECNRFLPQLRCHIIKSGKPYPVEADVLITNYHKLNGWAETLAGKCRTVIFDEAQELRKAESQDGPTKKYSAASHIAELAEIRLQLTATPIYNYGGEMFNVLSILDPNALGNKEEFQREWTTGNWDKAQLTDPKAFGTYLRDAGLMLRRTRAEVGRELPGLTTIPYEIDSDKAALDAVKGDIQDLARLILSDAPQVAGDKFRASGELDFKMRRATGMAKANFVAQFVQMLLEAGERVVLYGWHHDVYEVWRAAFKDVNPAWYTGCESPTKKEAEINRFKAGQTPLAVLSLRSGAGLDGLQGVCRTVVFGELDWSPGVHEQAIGRVHRDGQSEPVCAYFLLADQGSDPIIADTLGVKKGQISGLRDPDAPLTEAGIDPDHIRKLAESILGKTTRPVAIPVVSPPPKVATPKPSFAQMSLFEEAQIA